MEVGPAGVHGALAAEAVELETKIVIEAVPLLFRSMEGDLAQVYRVKLSRATEDTVLVCMASVNYKRTLVLLCPKHHQSLWVSLNFNVVNGGWSSWGSWSRCSKTCGTGLYTRYRACTAPRPSYGGKSCVGSSRQQHSCSNRRCTSKCNL